MIAGIIGILFAGCAYLPVDINYPEERIGFMLKDSAAKRCLGREDIAFDAASGVPGKGEHKIRPYGSQEAGDGGIVPYYNAQDAADGRRGESCVRPTSTMKPPTPSTLPGHSTALPAYVIYTSGSTGTPKGVLVEHRSIVNLCSWHNRYYQITPEDRASCYASFGFDASVWEMFPYLVNNVSVHIVPEKVKPDMHALNTFLETHGVTVSFLPTPVYEQFMQLENNSLRLVLTGGDRLTHYLPNNYRVVNNYGPTENTVVTTCFEIVDADFPIPIGKPIDNTSIYVLDKQDGLQPVGVPGELCVGGSGLARGYLNRPELTAASFVGLRREAYRISQIAQIYKKDSDTEALPSYSPHSTHSPYSTLYKTGDLVSWLEDGNIRFLGRVDHQVKIRGFRIELGEIENLLVSFPLIEEAVVNVIGEDSGSRSLCAYFVSSETVDTNDLSQHLSKRLPDHMIPKYFMQLENLPLTVHGKVNRRVLPEPETIADSSSFTAPREGVEQKLAEIWSDVLQCSPRTIGIDDNFFHLGGHSLSTSLLVTRIKKSLFVHLSFADVFFNPHNQGNGCIY